MPDALNYGGPPPAPRPDESSGGSNVISMVTRAPMLGGGGAPQGGEAAAPLAALSGGQQPAPSHGQTVAALRHFAAIQGVLANILRDPALGKSNVKSKIIDGVTHLVAQRIMSPATAVTQLQDVPDAPFKQKQWLQQHLESTIQAQNTVLDHHRTAHAGMPDDQVDKAGGAPDDHMTDMQALQAHYR